MIYFCIFYRKHTLISLLFSRHTNPSLTLNSCRNIYSLCNNSAIPPKKVVSKFRYTNYTPSFGWFTIVYCAPLSANIDCMAYRILYTHSDCVTKNHGSSTVMVMRIELMIFYKGVLFLTEKQ